MISQEFIDSLADTVGLENLLLDEPMSSHTTFHVGGPADCFVIPESVDTVRDVVTLCRDRDVDFYVVGCGSNLLVADGGLRGVVIKMGSKLSGIRIDDEGAVCVQAGSTNAKIAHVALGRGLAGFEFAAGIPGSIGGAAIMNAGAYGGELKDVATGVTCLTPAGEIVDLTAEEAQWGYRHSKMQEDGSIVLQVQIQLTHDDPDLIRDRMADLAQRRTSKQPLDLPSAGSTFKRPPGHFAGKLIQDAGMQGHTVGGAQVSTKHAGFVVNVGGATASDVMQVIEDVQAAVLSQFGVVLEPEVRRWGF